MNPGGGSGWDEPPLDIQVPDDARELDRDVLAYHRELRAKRRRNRLKRLARPFGPLATRGTVMPLLASILAVCLVAGAMLSVATFSPATTPGQKHQDATAAATAPPRSTASSRPSATGNAAASNTATGTGTAAASNAATGTAAAIGPAATGTAATGTSATGPGAARTAASSTSGPQASHSVSPSASSSRTRPAVRASGSGLAAAPR